MAKKILMLAGDYMCTIEQILLLKRSKAVHVHMCKISTVCMCLELISSTVYYAMLCESCYDKCLICMI
jgi:hypothetical protein